MPAARPPSSTTRMSRGHQIRSEEHTSELQSLRHLVCRLLLGKKKRSGGSDPLVHHKDNIAVPDAHDDSPLHVRAALEPHAEKADVDAQEMNINVRPVSVSAIC